MVPGWFACSYFGHRSSLVLEVLASKSGPSRKLSSNTQRQQATNILYFAKNDITPCIASLDDPELGSARVEVVYVVTPYIHHSELAQMC